MANTPVKDHVMKGYVVLVLYQLRSSAIAGKQSKIYHAVTKVKAKRAMVGLGLSTAIKRAEDRWIVRIMPARKNVILKMRKFLTAQDHPKAYLIVLVGRQNLMTFYLRVAAAAQIQFLHVRSFATRTYLADISAFKDVMRETVPLASNLYLFPVAVAEIRSKQPVTVGIQNHHGV